MLKIENIKLAPGGGMAALTAETARILKVREKDLQSVRLLADCMDSFNSRCAAGITADREKCRENLHNSLMLVTALSPHIGYEKAAKVAKLAYEKNISLREAALTLGFLTGEQFDQVFRPEQMV